MRTIQVSEEVYEYLNSKAVGFELNSPDAVLRKELGINSTLKNRGTAVQTKILLRVKGVDFPEGMQLRFKGRPGDTATVKNGAILYSGQKYKSPSSAAVAANNGTATNGWIHWEYLDTTTGTWKLIDSLRARN